MHSMDFRYVAFDSIFISLSFDVLEKNETEASLQIDPVNGEGILRISTFVRKRDWDYGPLEQ